MTQRKLQRRRPACGECNNCRLGNSEHIQQERESVSLVFRAATGFDGRSQIARARDGNEPKLRIVQRTRNPQSLIVPTRPAVNHEHRGTCSRDCVLHGSASRLGHETSGIQSGQSGFFPSPETHIHSLHFRDTPLEIWKQELAVE